MNQEILKYREEINKLDKSILDSLEKRMKISFEIGKIKKENNLPIENKKREEEIIGKLKENSKLNKKFIEELYIKIFKESKRLQE